MSHQGRYSENMNIKTKIALGGLFQKIDRGIITLDQGAVEFQKITGYTPNEVGVPVDQKAAALGEFLEHLATTLTVKNNQTPEPEVAQPEKDLEPEKVPQKKAKTRKDKL